MIKIEEDAYQHNSDTLSKLYPGSYAADVLSSFYKIRIPDKAGSLQKEVQNAFLKKDFWTRAESYNNKIIYDVAKIYTGYLSDSGDLFKTGIKSLFNKIPEGSTCRNRLAQVLFNNLTDDMSEQHLTWFLQLVSGNPELFANEVLKEKCKRLLKVTAGQKAPDIFLPNEEEKEIHLQDVVKSNRFTLLLLWDPDCEHCVADMPVIAKAYQKFHSKGLEIYAASLNEDRAKWLKVIHQNRTAWRNVHVTESTKTQTEQYFITFTPTIVLINQEGIIVSRQLVAENLDAVLSKLLQK